MEKKKKKKTAKELMQDSEYIMRNRYMTRFIAIAAMFIVLIFLSFFCYDRFYINHSCFTFYVNVMDRDLNQRILTDEEVRAAIDRVCIANGTGYTIWTGQGGYINDNGEVVSEDTYILRINNLTPKDADRLGHAFIDECNSTAFMVEENRSKAVLHLFTEKH